MPVRHDNPRSRARTRILVETLVGSLMIGGALLVRDSQLAGRRVGELLLLLSGALFILVVIVDSTRRFRHSPPLQTEGNDRTRAPRTTPRARGPGRVRPGGPLPRTRS